MQSIDPTEVIKKALAGIVDLTASYTRPLPSALRKWYVYTLDGGHSIVCWLEEHRDVIRANPQEAWQECVPVPVKTVLRLGYDVVDGCIVVKGLTYDPFIGVEVPDGDDEFQRIEPTDASSMMMMENGTGYPSTITRTNYFQSPMARGGYCFLTWNNRTARLLMPRDMCSEIVPEVRGASHVIISFDGQHYDLLFEDHTDSPYALMLTLSLSDRSVPRSDSGRTDLTFIGYDDDLNVVVQLPAKFRFVHHCPSRQPWPSGS